MSTGFSDEVRAIGGSRSGGLCEICGAGRVTEHHHRRPRGSGGTRRTETNQASNLLATCNACHRMIESNRTVARLLGWLVPQGKVPALTPVMYRGEWCYLNDDGTVLTEDGVPC